MYNHKIRVNSTPYAYSSHINNYKTKINLQIKYKQTH